MDFYYKNSNLRFRVEIDGIQQAGFLECTGLGSSIEVLQTHEGTDTTIRKIPGKTTYPNVKLTWAAAADLHLYNWYKEAANGNIFRKNISVILINAEGDDEARWNITHAWPCAYEGPVFSTLGAEVATESLTLVCEKIEKVG